MAEGTNNTDAVRPFGWLRTDKDFWWGWITMIMLLALIVFGFYAVKSGKSLEGAGMILGALTTKVGTMIDYMYGASKKKTVSTDEKES